MDDEAPGLGVGFAIEPDFSGLTQLLALMDSAEGRVLREAQSIEKATSGMVNLAGATAQVTTFGNAATRTFGSAEDVMQRAEKAAETLTRSLTRQNDTFGMTKAGAAAYRAEMAGATDAANGLRAAEAANLALKADARLAAEARAAQERAVSEAAVNAQLLERSRLEAALERNTGVGRTSATASGATYSALAERERELELTEKQTAAERDLAQQTRQQNSLLAERASLQSALERTTGVGRVRATDAGATYSALAAKAAEDEAREALVAAAAEKRLADEHERLAAMVRASHDAQEADAVAAERLREATDPLYAATKRLNAEIAESTRLYHQGATAPEEYARQQAVLAGRLRDVGAAHDVMAVAGGKNAFALKEVGLQLPDIFEGLTTGQKPMQVFIQQGSQIAQIAMMAEGGVAGLSKQVGLLALRFAPLAIIAGVAFGAVKLFQSQVKDDGDLTRYRDSLGLTHKEMLQLSDGTDKAGDKIARLSGVTVTFGDVMAGLGKAVTDSMGNSSGWDRFEAMAVSAFKKVLDAWNVVSAGITAGIYGTFDAVKVAWGSFPAVFGDLFVQGVNAAIGALNRLVKLGIDQLNTVITTANKLPGVNLGTINAPQIAPVDNAYAGAAAKAATQISTSYSKAYADARKADAAFWAQVGANARQHAKDRMAEEAAAIKADRTPKKPHEDKHAETLEREARAEEAQIKNLGLLAAAYGLSGAAALLAEAREKAESKAIKDRGDIEAEVDRQVRLAIAQRIADAAKTTRAMNDQAAIQEQVNAQVTAGLIPAGQATQAVQDQIALLPVQQAAQAALDQAKEASAKGDVVRAAQFQQAATEAVDALGRETAAQLRRNAAARAAQVNTANASADNQLEILRAELTLIGATDAARVHELATIKAQQDAVALGLKVGTAAYDDYVAKQVKVADGTQTVADATRHWNEQLGYVADSMARVHETAQLTSQSLSDAFGTAGKAAGDALTSITGYYAQQSRLQKEHDDQIKAAGTSQSAIDKANADFQRGSDDARMGSLIGLTSAAKGFFKENSTGYKTMETAEKALTLVQLARTAVDVAGGAAKMFSELGPWAFPAVAAMLGVMASLGFSGGSGVSTADYTKGNTGTGTVLGDSTAQSASIKNAITALKDVDDATLTVSRNMLASLQSIENSLGGLATQLVRAGDINADAGIKTGTSGTALSGIVKASVPLVGTFLGGVIDKLFGTKTTIVGNGLYGASQSVGDIIDGGFDAQYYSDIEKKKKFFGITTSTKLSTQYTGADSGIEDQFTLLIKQFYDTIGQAAGPLGANLDAIDAKLQGFTVDIGKIDLKGLTGDQIEEKLEAVFGAAADDMAAAAFPDIEKFQKVGEGAFETLVRVSTTVEQVDAVFRKLGVTSTTMGVDVDMAVAGLFDSVSDFTSAAGTYFQDFFTKGEQAAAEGNQIARAMDALGLAMPDTLDGFRDLVQAQDLTTAAGQQTYATLLQLAPAFFDLKTNLEGAKSAADVLSEQQDLQSKLWDLLGDTADIRAAELAKLDPSNRALQEQIYAVQDAQDAAKAASDLADAWKSVGDNIMDEINRIRGLGDTSSGASFAQLMGQFNAATTAARAGDQTAAGNLPALSKSLLDAAATAASSRQELDRVQAQTAASLQTTYDTIEALSGQASGTASDAGAVGAAAAASSGTGTDAASDDLTSELAALRSEVAQLRADTGVALTSIAASTGGMKKTLDAVTADSAGQAVSVAAARAAA